jgi:hypothetical protein
MSPDLTVIHHHYIRCNLESLRHIHEIVILRLRAIKRCVTRQIYEALRSG